jgi:hypothetical protein
MERQSIAGSRTAIFITQIKNLVGLVELILSNLRAFTTIMSRLMNLFLVVRKFYKIELGLFLILQFLPRRLWTTFFCSRRALVVCVLIMLKLKNETQNFDHCV